MTAHPFLSFTTGALPDMTVSIRIPDLRRDTKARL
jgi:hypothetical protein